MADASLRIPITADASQFIYTLEQIKAKLESLRNSLSTAKGEDIGVFNLDIKKFEQQKKAIENYGKFAEGTFGSLLRQLKDLKDYQLTLQYNSAEFKQAQADIDATSAKIKDLTSTPKEVKIVIPPTEGSIAALRKQIDELNAKKINIDIANEGEIAQINTEIDQLTSKIKKADSLGFDKNGKVSQNANKARIALTNLKLVAQDLPFGFIAIQNNLPNLIESFDNLKKDSGGLKGALKELGSQLVGPGGVFLAFSVVTAAITYAIKEYGSLNLAVKAFLGTAKEIDFVNKRASESLKKYNEELTTNGEIIANASANAADEIARIGILSEAVRDNTLSQTQRANALKELQKIDPKTLENLNLQEDGYKKLDKWVKNYTDSLIANAVAQEYLSRIVSVTTQINTQTNLLAEISKGYEDIAKKKREAEAGPIYDPATGADLTPTILGGLATRTENLNKVFSDQTNIVSGLYKQLDQYKKSAQDATKESLKFFKEGIGGGGGDKNIFAPQIDTQALDEAYNLDSIISNLTKYGNILIDVNKSEAERKNALRELNEINPKYFQSFVIGKSSISEAKTELEGFIKTLLIEKKTREDALRVSQLNADFRKNEEKGIVSLGDKYNIFSQQLSSIPTTMKEIEDGFEQAAIASDTLTKSVSPLANIERVTEPLKFLQEQMQLAYTAINQIFFAPLENLFETFLTKGEIAFKDFTKAVGKSIAQIAAKLAATGIIKGLMLLLDPSGALANLGGSFGGVQGGNGILDALGGIFGRRQRNPDFNRVSPSRGLGGDRVEFTIRGTNLVGVLNRANGEINRIG